MMMLVVKQNMGKAFRPLSGQGIVNMQAWFGNKDGSHREMVQEIKLLSDSE